MNTITILKCRLVTNEHDSVKLLDFKVYDSEESAIKKMESIAQNLTLNKMPWHYINNNKGISCQTTKEYYPRQEWVVYQEIIRTW